MKFFVSTAHHQRLLVIGLLSLLLHLLALALIDARRGPLQTTIGNPALTLRLVEAVPTPVPPLSRQALANLPPPAPTPAPPSLPAAAPEPPEPAQQAAAAPAELPAAAPDQAQVQNSDTPPEPPAGRAPPVRMPRTYRVTPPPSGRIDYLVTDAGAAATEPTSASMTWSNAGTRYQVDIDGVMGQLHSVGQVGDTGIAPSLARAGSGLAAVETAFDEESRTITAGPDLQPFAYAPGSQDTASVLLQLAGMGVADSNQMKGTLSFWVGGALGAGIERYEVLGQERIDTGEGELDTVRLARIGKPGEPRLELWLAPLHAWLPVQLRVTDANGAARTQTLAAITFGPDNAQ